MFMFADAEHSHQQHQQADEHVLPFQQQPPQRDHCPRVRLLSRCSIVVMVLCCHSGLQGNGLSWRYLQALRRLCFWGNMLHPRHERCVAMRNLPVSIYNSLDVVVLCRYDLGDEEVLAHFVTLLKATSFKLNRDSVQFFFQLDATGRRAVMLSSGFSLQICCPVGVDNPHCDIGIASSSPSPTPPAGWSI
jgi:hypothetical protein